MRFERKRSQMNLLMTVGALVQCNLVAITTAVYAQAADESPTSARADAEDTSVPNETPQFVEKKIVVRAPAPTYSRDQALIDITCNLRVDYPHNSSHVDGTVNVETQVICDSPVSGITLLIQLYYNGSVAGSNINENAGEASLYNQVAAPCVDGGWQAHAEALVAFPPGTTPPSAYDSEDSPPISIDCNQ